MPGAWQGHFLGTGHGLLEMRFRTRPPMCRRCRDELIAYLDTQPDTMSLEEALAQGLADKVGLP